METKRLNVGECFNRIRKAATKWLKHRDLFELRPSRDLRGVYYELVFKDYNKYRYLEDLSVDQFKYLVSELLFIKEKAEGAKKGLAILGYNLGWKKYVGFHMRLYPRTVDDYRAVLNMLWDDDEDDEGAANLLTKNERKPASDAENIAFRQHVRHIQEHGGDPDFFYQRPLIRSECGNSKILISRKTHCIVALDSSITFDLSGEYPPFHIVYRYARSLEVELGKVVGRMMFAIDHTVGRVWVWGMCTKKDYEKFLRESRVEQNGEFQDIRDIPDRTGGPTHPGGVLLKNLPESVTENSVNHLMSKFGEVTKVYLHRYSHLDPTPNGVAKVYFADDGSVKRALGEEEEKEITVQGYIVKIKTLYSD